MLVHDWCKLSFTYGKRDLTQLTHATDIGYELTTALLVSPDEGNPLAPMEIHLKTAGGMLSTREPGRLTSTIWSRFCRRCVPAGGGIWTAVLHVIDREADSLDHFRQWDTKGHHFLVRADDRRVQWSGKSVLLSEIRRSLTHARRSTK